MPFESNMLYESQSCKFCRNVELCGNHVTEHHFTHKTVSPLEFKQLGGLWMQFSGRMLDQYKCCLLCRLPVTTLKVLLYLCVHTFHITYVRVRGQTLQSQFPPTWWVLRIKLRLSDLAASVFSLRLSHLLPLYFILINFCKISTSVVISVSSEFFNG